jgi:hypothetical protein
VDGAVSAIGHQELKSFFQEVSESCWGHFAAAHSELAVLNLKQLPRLTIVNAAMADKT